MRCFYHNIFSRSVFFLVCVILITSSKIQSQSKKNYKERFVDGVYFLDEENYSAALFSFTQAYLIDSTNSNINFNLGFTYLNSLTEKRKALRYLKKASLDISEKYTPFSALEKSAPTSVYFYLGVAYRLNYNFREAIASFERYKNYLKATDKEALKEVDRQIEVCRNAMEIYIKPVDINVSMIKDSVNSAYPDYSPVISADESTLIFTSRRPEGTGYELTPTGEFYEDIYISHKNEAGKWTKPASIGASINTAGHEASVSLSPNGDQLLIYRDDNGDGNIYISTLEGDTWSSPEKLGSDINSTYWEPSACISPDGSMLYFVSDRPGGFGGRDIYRCVKLPNGEWSLATNLGPTINTAYDEDAPFMHPDGVTFVFSSNGHKTTGGFDVFYSTIQEDTKFAPVKNMGVPINTPDDDIFYVLSPDGKRAYYSSTKSDGAGEKDIYLITLLSSVVDPVTLLKGFVTIDGSTSIPSDFKITVIDKETGLLVQDIKPNSKTGKYILALNSGVGATKSFIIKYEAKGYESIEELLEIDSKSSYQEVQKEVDLKPVNFESKRPGTVSLVGSITDNKSTRISNAIITVKENVTGIPIGIYEPNKLTGRYYVNLERGKNYHVSFEADGYLFHTENVNVPAKSEYLELLKNVVLEPIKTGSSIVLNNIFFDSNKSILRKESTLELEKLKDFLVSNPAVKAEISGHTDNSGTAAANLKLSKDRAQAVVNYLIANGISKARIISKGYGMAKPLFSNSTADGKPDSASMQLNRRVELKIID
ncbi:MAG: PD40 domain-containing protein [Bacteroidetes bacterium]|nr:PD40 domain-containing protein [Bacteroidota bacterium]